MDAASDLIKLALVVIVAIPILALLISIGVSLNGKEEDK